MKPGLRPPGPKPRLPGANLLGFRRNPIAFLMKLAHEYGDIVRFRSGLEEVFFLNHPDYVRDVLVTHADYFAKGRALERARRLLGEGLLTSEGEFHKRQRRLVQPAFHRQRLASYGATITEHAARLRRGWDNGARMDIHQEMLRLTMGITGKTLFDADIETEATEIGEALSSVLELFKMIYVPFSEFLEKLPLPGLRRRKTAHQRLDATVYRMIQGRRASGQDRGDLLSLLLAAQDDEGEGEHGRMTDQQVRDECMTLFLASHETTANALTWTWYLLSQHPQVEAKLHHEIDAVLAGRLPTAEDLRQLSYTEMVLSESMRLYPPAWAVGRRIIRPYSVGPYICPENSLVILSQYVMHHDPRFFPDPFRFDPERWTAEARAALPKFCYFPFGAGPRQCIGEGFAWMEGVLVLATLAQQWRMRLVPGHPVELQPLITLRPKHGMLMTLERR